LLADEAYYALFAGKIDWGYFDHPPVVALMIKAGLWLGNTEAGVRCVAVLLSAGSIFLIEQLIKPNNPLLFYGLILATAIFHFMGFVATPDVPFLLFAVLFWLVYQRWSIGYSAKDAVFAGVLAGVMLLSKYHGILVIGFTVLSNPGIFKRKTFWLAVILAVIILLPHLFWQINHGFPTLQYHLSDRGSLGMMWLIR
jgi:4-amino-4-deoxy-L-arabinose transferase-like glycosyltransferase